MSYKVNKYKDALQDMVWQFGFRGTKEGKPIIWTGGLSALEGAFEALGWEDLHYLPDAEGYCCEIKGCVEPDTSGLRWGGLYLRLCHEHTKQQFEGKPRPKVKQWAIDRESKRDPITRILPV
ncbi:MAG: hypothetical protein H8E40_07530 [Chloroflexi bacterium]|nr:hypothetical protein [Chloroflexota bacterium]